MHAVRDHATSFRLAAVWRDRIFLYQAWRSARARTGADLFDIAGKVMAIEVQRAEVMPPLDRRGVAITAAADVEALVEMIRRGPVRRPQPHAVAEPRYWLTLWLTDGTTLGRAFFVETSELMGGLVLPPGFREVLDRYLGP
jgi:hypothetical protein